MDYLERIVGEAELAGLFRELQGKLWQGSMASFAVQKGEKLDVAFNTGDYSMIYTYYKEGYEELNIIKNYPEGARSLTIHLIMGELTIMYQTINLTENPMECDKIIDMLKETEGISLDVTNGVIIEYKEKGALIGLAKIVDLL